MQIFNFFDFSKIPSLEGPLGILTGSAFSSGNWKWAKKIKKVCAAYTCGEFEVPNASILHFQKLEGCACEHTGRGKLKKCKFFEFWDVQYQNPVEILLIPLLSMQIGMKNGSKYAFWKCALNTSNIAYMIKYDLFRP